MDVYSNRFGSICSFVRSLVEHHRGLLSRRVPSVGRWLAKCQIWKKSHNGAPRNTGCMPPRILSSVSYLNPVGCILCSPVGWRLQPVRDHRAFWSPPPLSSHHRNLEPWGGGTRQYISVSGLLANTLSISYESVWPVDS